MNDAQLLAFFVLIAVALGLQLVLSTAQAMAFTRAINQLRRHGRVGVGMGGGKWFGRKVYVAVAVDSSGLVVRAIRLRGISQFARARETSRFTGWSPARLASDEEIPGCSRPERAAARQAAQTLDAAGGMPTASGAPGGEERHHI
jgi:DNA-binding transcriptional regulator of glucitol operon